MYLSLCVIALYWLFHVCQRLHTCSTLIREILSSSCSRAFPTGVVNEIIFRVLHGRGRAATGRVHRVYRRPRQEHGEYGCRAGVRCPTVQLPSAELGYHLRFGNCGFGQDMQESGEGRAHEEAGGMRGRLQSLGG